MLEVLFPNAPATNTTSRHGMAVLALVDKAAVPSFYAPFTNVNTLNATTESLALSLDQYDTRSYVVHIAPTASIKQSSDEQHKQEEGNMSGIILSNCCRINICSSVARV